MPPLHVPDTTSAEAIDLYPAGRKVAGGCGPAWREVRASILSLPRETGVFTMPATAEPMIVLVLRGEAEAQERENGGPWLKNRLRAGSLYITAAGAPYDFQVRTLGAEPFEVLTVLLSLPLFGEALADVFGGNAEFARLRDVSGFEDSPLAALLQRLREELERPTASALYVRGIGQALAVHLARHYTALTEGARGENAALPGFKLRRITDWMAEHLAEEFCLARLAERAGMSEFHFNRLFKRATGVPPSQYQIRLRLDAARRLLRETERSVITVANDVGYSNPSHFARLFRKETGLSPSDYRRQR
ncbi:MAG: AraC family transcriptional regulator [Opitutaceae bacterium]